MQSARWQSDRGTMVLYVALCLFLSLSSQVDVVLGIRCAMHTSQASAHLPVYRTLFREVEESSEGDCFIKRAMKSRA